MSMEIAARLREERKKHKVPLKVISELTKLNERSYRTYEKDATHLTVTTLHRLASTGIDIFYVIFGQRLANTLAADEQAILEDYHAMSARERAGLLGMMAGLKSANNSTHVLGQVNQSVAGSMSGNMNGNINGNYVQGNTYTVQVEKKPF